MHEIFGISMAHPMDSASCNWMVYVGFPVPRRWWCSRTRDGGRIITSQYTGPCPFGPKIASEADQPRDLAGLAWTCPKCQTFCSLPKLMCFWAFLGDFPDFLFHLKFLPSEQVSAGWSVRCAGYCITAPATCLQPRPHPPRSSQLHQPSVPIIICTSEYLSQSCLQSVCKVYCNVQCASFISSISGYHTSPCPNAIFPKSKIKNVFIFLINGFTLGVPLCTLLIFVWVGRSVLAWKSGGEKYLTNFVQCTRSFTFTAKLQPNLKYTN